jgi:cupin fold WbuC family metalloprotein
MSTALEPPTGPCHFVDAERIAAGIAASHASPRRRVIVPVHRSNTATVQRMLNIVQPGSYIRPHIHPLASGVELVCVLQGAAMFLLFDDHGTVTARRTLTPGPGTSLADLEPRIHHTYCALAPDTVILEIKGGPYDPALDKTWPDWAPAEDSPAAADYLARLLADAESL